MKTIFSSMTIAILATVAFATAESRRDIYLKVPEKSRVKSTDELAPLLSDLRRSPTGNQDAVARLASGLSSRDFAIRTQTARTIELLARDQARKGVDPKSDEAKPALKLLHELKLHNLEYFLALVSNNEGTAFANFLKEVQS